MIDENDIMSILREVVDPELNVSIVDQGAVKNIVMEGSKVTVVLSNLYAGISLADYLREIIRGKLISLPEIDEVVVEFNG